MVHQCAGIDNELAETDKLQSSQLKGSNILTISTELSPLPLFVYISYYPCAILNFPVDTGDIWFTSVLV